MRLLAMLCMVELAYSLKLSANNAGRGYSIEQPTPMFNYGPSATYITAAPTGAFSDFFKANETDTLFDRFGFPNFDNVSSPIVTLRHITYTSPRDMRKPVYRRVFTRLSQKMAESSKISFAEHNNLLRIINDAQKYAAVAFFGLWAIIAPNSRKSSPTKSLKPRPSRACEA